MLMPIHIESGLTDDNDFVALIRTVIDGVSARQAPDQIWIIHINNWFDHKWLRFSGYGSGASWMFSGSPGPISFESLAARFDSVKETFFKTKVTFPPFSPERVLGQWSFVKSGDDYIEIPLPTIPHGSQKAHSETNLNRRVEHFSQSAVFVWYSGNTLANGRGSLMVYAIDGADVDCWFASFHRNPVWSLGKTKGTSRDNVLDLMNQSVLPSAD
jgi:hypothetical protein